MLQGWRNEHFKNKSESEPSYLFYKKKKKKKKKKNFYQYFQWWF